MTPGLGSAQTAVAATSLSSNDSSAIPPATPSGGLKPRSGGAVRSAARRFRRKPAPMAALIYVLIVCVAGALAPLIAPHDPAKLLSAPFQGPSSTYWFGTDESGRDVFSRILFGARLSMAVSFTVVALAVFVALFIGLVSGYLGGKVDEILMRAMDALSSIPSLIFAIALVAVLGSSLRNAAIAIAVISIPNFARLIRGQTLAIRQQTFVDASRIAGSPHHKIIVRRVLPSVLSPLIVMISIELGSVMIVEASLSFLGLGAQPPAASWGLMLSRAYGAVIAHPWHALPSGAALILTVLAFNIVGNGIRECLREDRPRNKGRRRLGITQVSRVTERPRQTAGTAPSTLTTPAAPDVVLSLEHLTVEMRTNAGKIKVVDDVSFAIRQGEILGLVGESGSGKTVTSMSIMRLLPSPPATITAGAAYFNNIDLFTLNLKQLTKIRGSQISMVFQDPQSSLNPSVTIGTQIAQVLRWHERTGRKEAWARAVEALDHVGIAAARAKAYPHELSGGMRQRAMIAMALISKPKLLIADEPTTALDVTIQAQVLELLKDLRDELNMSILLVTHDLGAVADTCDRVAVMYAGQIVETAPVHDLFSKPQHPYSAGLLHAMPTGDRPTGPLFVIPGQVPSFDALPAGCRFAARCQYTRHDCHDPLTLSTNSSTSAVRCVRSEELHLQAAATPDKHLMEP